MVLMTLEELIEEMKQKMRRYDLTEQCKQAYIGEWTYGVTMIPCEQVLPYLEELKQLRKEFISKEKIKEIIYPTPENEVPIEVQTSEMYSKLQKLLGE